MYFCIGRNVFLFIDGYLLFGLCCNVVDILWFYLVNKCNKLWFNWLIGYECNDFFVLFCIFYKGVVYKIEMVSL